MTSSDPDQPFRGTEYPSLEDSARQRQPEPNAPVDYPADAGLPPPVYPAPYPGAPGYPPAPGYYPAPAMTRTVRRSRPAPTVWRSPRWSFRWRR